MNQYAIDKYIIYISGEKRRGQIDGSISRYLDVNKKKVKKKEKRKIHVYKSAVFHLLFSPLGHEMEPHKREDLVGKINSSVQFKMVSMCSGRPIICAPPRLSGVSPVLPLKQFQFGISKKIVERFLFLLYASLLEAIDGVMSLALCP